MAAKPFCHLQYFVTYSSRLQRIQPTAREEGSFEAAYHSTSAGQAEPKARAIRELPNVDWGERRAQAPIASLDSDLEMFSHNAPLVFQPSAMTKLYESTVSLVLD